jgi:hypothetical protein
MKASLRITSLLRPLFWAPLLALLFLGCKKEPPIEGPPSQRIWLNSPVDGVLTLEDREPPPF